MVVARFGLQINIGCSFAFQAKQNMVKVLFVFCDVLFHVFGYHISRNLLCIQYGRKLDWFHCFQRFNGLLHLAVAFKLILGLSV